MEASSPAARCQSCGGPSADGDLCKSCKQAFAPVLGSATVTQPSDDARIAGLQKAPAIQLKAATVIKTTPATPAPVATTNVSTNAIQIEISKSDTAKAVADLTAKAHLAKAANPAPPVPKRPIVAAPPQPRSRSTVWIKAAALIVIAIGAAEGARRAGFQWPQQQVVPEALSAQPAPVVESVTAANREATPSETVPVAPIAAEKRASPVEPSKVAASTKPTTAAGRRRTARQENALDQNVAPAVASAPAPEPPAPVAARAAAPVAVEPAPPIGRVFERNDVDEPPQIATRVEPKLPANLPGRPKNAVAVVRVLVSRTGHPFRVSLLRGSMLGGSADAAVIAAVTRWTFSPAKKRGEAVNCWYNVGVPLGQAN